MIYNFENINIGLIQKYMALIIDVETTGFPQRDGLPYGQNPPFEKINMYDSSRIIQISIMVCCENLEQVELKDFIVKADDFTICNSEFHGITHEISLNKGVSFTEIAKELSSCLKHVSHIIAHNANFDICIIKSELYRIGLSTIIDEIKTKKILCTMNDTKSIVNAKNSCGRIKDPKLSELYNFVFKADIENEHNSKYDVINLHKIVKTLYDSQKLYYNKSFIYRSYQEKQEEHSCLSTQERVDFSKLKLTELHKYCRENGIKGYNKMNKLAIIETIKEKLN